MHTFKLVPSDADAASSPLLMRVGAPCSYCDNRYRLQRPNGMSRAEPRQAVRPLLPNLQPDILWRLRNVVSLDRFHDDEEVMPWRHVYD